MQSRRPLLPPRCLERGAQREISRLCFLYSRNQGLFLHLPYKMSRFLSFAVLFLEFQFTTGGW